MPHDTNEDFLSKVGASQTMEWCYNDWCVHELAKALGKKEEADYFGARALNYQNLFDPETGFIRPKNSKGEWLAPFNPEDTFKNGFCECSSWEYTFLVQHDIQGLINLVGGREEFISRLDYFFSRGNL
jgi:putative alpha-1,2-mannosidase